METLYKQREILILEQTRGNYQNYSNGIVFLQSSIIMGSLLERKLRL